MALYGNSTYPKTELLINGTWTDISTKVRVADGGKIAITRGRANEQARVAAQTCDLTINNRDGVYSNRNPNSAYYGLLTRNTQIRVAAGTGDVYGKLPYREDGGQLDYFYAASAAALNITGDIEVRVDILPHLWRPGTYMVLAGKWGTGSNQRSWILYLGADGYLKFRWTTAGTTATQITATATATIPTTSGRLSIKATLKANNGAAGNTVTFYTATTIGGTYAQLGSAVITAGTTSIFSSTALLTVGGGYDSGGVFSDGMPFGGRVYAAQVYNGIGGTLVADLDITARSVGDTTWTDSVTRVWSTWGTARVTSDRLRFWGELSSMPQTWDKTGRDVWVPARASGMIRRLTQGASPIRSAMYRNFTQYSPHGYWPLEDGSTALSAASAVTGSTAAIATACSFDVAGAPGAESAVQFTASTSKLTGSATTATSTNFASFVMYVKVDALPAAGSPGFFNLYGTGKVARVDIGLSSTTWVLNYYDVDGTLLLSSNVTHSGTINISPAGKWVGINVLLTLSGGNVQSSVRWEVAGADAGGIGPTTVAAGSVGRWNRFRGLASGDTTFQALRLSHVFMSTQNLNLSTSAFRSASNAYYGETAVTRVRRLASEESIPIEVSGINADSETVGYQTLSTVMDLIYDCADADQGMLGESRDSLALTYRTRVDLERRKDMTLLYHSNHLSDVPQVPDDDSGIVNDVTVSRSGGSSARAIVSSGALSTAAPPNGVGTYDTAVTVNAVDSRLAQIAGWKAFIGTWDDPRVPQLAISLHRTPFLSSASLSTQAYGVELGDTVYLSGLPSWLPPDDIPLLVQGYTESLDHYLWDLTFNTTPAGPYSVPLAANVDYVGRADSSNTVLNAAVNTTATSIGLKTSTGALWVTTATYPAEFPFDIKIAGEVMTITAITGTTSPQTATVTRSVNGIIKSQVINAPIYLAQPAYVGL